MLVEGQLIKVKITKNVIQHYLDLGYDVQSRDIIFVPPEHLTSGSHAMVTVICDICGCSIDRTYKQYLHCHTNGIDTCSKCKDVKAKTTCMRKYGVPTHMLVPEIQNKQKSTIQERYGVDYISQDETIKQKKKATCLMNYGVENPMFSEDLKNKMIDTNLKKYGVKNAMQNPLIRQRAEETCVNKYGVPIPTQNENIKLKIQETCLCRYGETCVLKNEEIKERIKETNIEKYGVDNPFAAEAIKQKICDTNMQKYGVPYSMQNKEVLAKSRQSMLQNFGYDNPQKCPEIKQKTMQTLSNNGTVPTSSQQLKLHDMIIEKYPDAILNYPYSTCALDIYVCVNGIKIDVEYDAQFFHDKQKDIRRDKFLQSEGFKTLRIRSGHLLPTEEQLFSAIDYLATTKHHFKEIVLSDWKSIEEVNLHGDENIA